MNHTITAGLLIRKNVRRFFLLEGIHFIEDKGLLESMFFFKCDYSTYNKIYKTLNNYYN